MALTDHGMNYKRLLVAGAALFALDQRESAKLFKCKCVVLCVEERIRTKTIWSRLHLIC
jgi:hypothetical protein